MTADPAPPFESKEFFRPSRVLISEEGEAVSPYRTSEQLDVIFVRDDGWSLGAPAVLEHAARSLWAGRWVAVWRVQPNGRWLRTWPLPDNNIPKRRVNDAR